MENHLPTLSLHFRVPVSCFRSVFSHQAVTTEMGLWLRSTIAPASEVEKARMEQVLEYRRTFAPDLKKRIPIFTPGALMNHRDKSVTCPPQLHTMTGWMQFDVDEKDNLGIGDAPHIRDEIAKIIYVAFCSISTSGKGVWGLVKVRHTESYREHFEQLKVDFASLGIMLDPSKGGNPTDPRFYTYDPDAYFASEFKVYDRMGGTELSVRTERTSEPRLFHGAAIMSNNGDTWNRVVDAVAHITHQRLDIAPDYDTYVKIGFAFAHEFGEAGRDLFHAVCQPSPKYKRADADRQFTACLRARGQGISIGTFFYIVRPYYCD